jgi:hypothetical protein
MFVRTLEQRLCEGPDHDDDAVEDAFEAPSVVALLNTKAKDGGGAYRCVALLSVMCVWFQRRTRLSFLPYVV